MSTIDAVGATNRKAVIPAGLIDKHFADIRQISGANRVPPNDSRYNERQCFSVAAIYF